MSLVGGESRVAAPTEDFVRVMAEIARGGSEFAARMDAYTKLRDEANAAIALVGEAQKIAPMLAEASTKLAAAEATLAQARIDATNLVTEARHNAGLIVDEQLRLRQEIEAAAVKARQVRDAAVDESNKIRREAAAILESAKAEATTISAQVQTRLKLADQEYENGKADRAEAAFLRKQAEDKLAKINAILRA